MGRGRDRRRGVNPEILSPHPSPPLLLRCSLFSVAHSLCSRLLVLSLLLLPCPPFSVRQTPYQFFPPQIYPHSHRFPLCFESARSPPFPPVAPINHQSPRGGHPNNSLTICERLVDSPRLRASVISLVNTTPRPRFDIIKFLDFLLTCNQGIQGLVW